MRSDDLPGGPLEDRTWVTMYGKHLRSDTSVTVDDVEELVEDFARKIERSAQCITVVDRVDGDPMGMGVGLDEHVMLRCVIARDADRDLTSALFDAADYRLHEAITQLEEA